MCLKHVVLLYGLGKARTTIARVEKGKKPFMQQNTGSKEEDTKQFCVCQFKQSVGIASTVALLKAALYILVLF